MLDPYLIPQNKLQLPLKYAHLSPLEYTEALIGFIEAHKHWTTLHIVDFITLHQWDTVLEEEWRQVLLPRHESEDEWIQSIIKIASGSDLNESWPESLKGFIQQARDIALPRFNLNGCKQSTIELDRSIQPGMTDKKKHEVERMTPVIQAIASHQQVNSIVDLGAGQGYLSRSLAFQSNLKVLAVDSSEIQTCGAKRFDERILKKLNKEALKLYHVTDIITPQNASSILSKWSEGEGQWLLCGLHTCGDLASMMIRLFSTSSDFTCFVNVGCCYHFLTEQHPSAGFPLSQAVQQSGLQLGPTPKMLSCQAPARWEDQLEETLMAYEHHFFRALLQAIMVKKGLTDASKAPVIGRLNKKKDFTCFSVYVQAALKRLDLPQTTIPAEEAEAYYDSYKARGVDKQIAIVWTLRVLLGPVLESLILMDRWLYLDQTIPDSPTKNIWMWPLFDPVSSPRNMVIAATK